MLQYDTVDDTEISSKTQHDTVWVDGLCIIALPGASTLWGVIKEITTQPLLVVVVVEEVVELVVSLLLLLTLEVAAV